MFKQILFLLLLLLTAPAIGQETFTFESDTKPVIKGKLIGYNQEVDTILSITASLVVPSAEFQSAKDIPIETDGTFQLTLDYPIANRQIWLRVGEYYFGELLFSEEIMVTIDLVNLKKIEKEYFHSEYVQFSGVDGPLTDYMNRFTSYRQSLEDNPYKEMLLVKRNEDLSISERLAQMRIHQKEVIQVREDFIAKNPSEHAWVLKNEAVSDFYSEVSTLYWGKEMSQDLLEEVLAHEPKFISNAGASYYRGLGFYFKGMSLQEYADNYKMAVLPTIVDAGEKQRLLDFIDLYQLRVDEQEYDKKKFGTESKYFFKTYKKEINTGHHKRFAAKLKKQNLPPEKEAIVISCAGSDDIWGQELYLSLLISSVQSNWVLNFMQKEWAKSNSVIDQVNQELAQLDIEGQNSVLGIPKGKLDNGSEFFLPEQTELLQLIAAIRAEHPDKAIILDLWATWCGPCISDMKAPTTAPNKKKLKEMGVEVIYLCTNSGSKEETWRKKVAELDMGPGKHLFLNDALASKMLTYFQLSGYPSYVFIDANGQYKPDVVERIYNIDFDKVKKNIR
ncbi:MAG: hypothetical protein Sapg2KO_13960 [Saprospiraceae bacterium]